MAPNFVKVFPPSVETWKSTLPVGVPYELETVTLAVIGVPKVTGLAGVRVGAVMVGMVFTVNDAKPLLTLL